MPKGDDDIRIVYDGTSGGINGVVWTPPFFRPTSNILTQLIESNTYQLDMDIGEMFLNFPLDPRVWKLCGVNLSGFDGLRLVDPKLNHMVWTTLWMGFDPSSAYSVRHLGLCLEIAKGDHLDPKNPFHWSKVVLNLPASQDFEPSMPCVYKLNMIVNKIAGDYVVFFDDIRVLGLSVKNCWQCGRKLSSNIQFLGIQDAARKKKPPSLTPGT